VSAESRGPYPVLMPVTYIPAISLRLPRLLSL
jgi:hypothetical protein